MSFFVVMKDQSKYICWIDSLLNMMDMGTWKTISLANLCRIFGVIYCANPSIETMLDHDTSAPLRTSWQTIKLNWNSTNHAKIYIIIIKIQAVEPKKLMKQRLTFRNRNTNFSKIYKRSSNLVQPLFIIDIKNSTIMRQQ